MGRQTQGRTKLMLRCTMRCVLESRIHMGCVTVSVDPTSRVYVCAWGRSANTGAAAKAAGLDPPNQINHPPPTTR